MVGALNKAITGRDITADVTPYAPADFTAFAEPEPEDDKTTRSVQLEDVRETPPAPAPSQELRFSPRAWQGIALALLFISIAWCVCGLLTNSIEPAEGSTTTESTDFWITRGFCLGPALIILFLAYLSFMAGRSKRSSVHCSEVVAVMGVALGLLPTLLGLAIAVQPEAEQGDRTFGPLLCILPGLFIVGLSGMFWALVARRVRSSS
jgi:hypothetical protein